MKRYFIYISYLGTNYSGWQIQPNAVTVQETVMQALSRILQEPIHITGAGRTDAGVHARCMPAHFDREEAIENLSKLMRGLNSLLPADISIYDLKEVAEDAHARFDATAREYEYHVVQHKSPFLTHLSTRFVLPLDFDAMNIAAQYLLEVQDFTSFSKLHTDAKTNICDVRKAYWEKRGEEWVFTIEADRFLRNMVRAVVGTLFEVGLGRIDLEEFKQIVAAKNRCEAGHSVPADGLYLTQVRYNY
ncbi:tRNA pseudouridine(38-40) synthase TruA [Gammaproteobacteria bacterium]|nr:tRNA pseudouridine(38-40) synthase TruA [Gammaproteobacteria bacterium]